VGVARWGIEPGETHQEAIVRELAEEAGIAIQLDQVGPPGGTSKVAS
jgi:8-oxo-dGTP pyrophosphatase MutT (NUDIX family)